MKQTTFQHPELRDANDNIIQQGAFGKNTALANSTNDGWIDYVANDLEALYDNINGSRIYVANKAALPATGDLSAMYIAEDTGKWYLWDGQKYIETDNARKIADEAIAARDAAKASQSAAKTSETNAKTSETNAAASKTAAATSASAAKTSENNAGTQANTAKAWATSTTSPDGAADTSSTTGKTQSAKSWAMYSKDRATASASSASAAAGSASAAKTSENNAASSKSAAATSATNAANSAKAAADSATAAANSAKEQQADWNVTDTTAKSYIKNKPSIKLSDSQNVSASLVINPTVTSYNEDLRLNQSSSGWATIYLGSSLNTMSGREEHAWGIFRDPSYALGIWPNGSANQGKKGLYLPLNGRATLDGKTVILDGDTVGKATADAAGNNIQTTYAKKSDLSSSVSTTSLTVSGETSVPTANAGNSSKAIANTEFVAKSLASLVNGAPAQLNTLNELAKALGNDANFSATITAELAKKLNSTEAESTYLPLSGGTLTGAINTANKTWNKLGDDASFGDYNIGGKMCIKTQTARKTGIAFFNQSDTNVGEVDVNNAFDFNKPVKENGGFLVPIGIVQAFAGRTTPQGWLLCDGSAVSRTDYAALFAVIGTTYGAGNGSTTFNLPNLIDKFVEGSATAGTVKSAGLPNITGNVKSAQKDDGLANGVFSQSPIKNFFYAGSPYTENDNATMRHIYLYFDASKSNAIYGKSNTVQPPAVTMRYIIKY